jgi:hypothetical protein
MVTNKNNGASKKLLGENMEICAGYHDVKAHLLLYLFIALEWITLPWKRKESRCTTGIGLS